MTSEDQERELKRLEVFAYKNLKRNSIISIADGAVFAIGSGMLPVSTVIVYLIFSLQGFFASFANITWFNLILKLVPERQRSKYFGIRSSIGGLCETFGAFLMGRILKLLHFPYNYGLLFIISFLIMMLSLYIASMMKEIPVRKPKKEIDNKHYFRNMFLILK